ncbi:aspartic proteinase CDR1-like [Papaver somniferum]|uniref:aspartic proteinase CDR1-like n=1 Tax=Papaver somniferum TaxID=3469 RepID=UPI000E6F8BDC|nr:aspartic proteinase CDR1-like [Papaver somniferum]
MGETLFLFLISITHVSLLLNSVIAVYPKKGFSIKMIHRDSKESPLYPGDHLTRGERLQRLVEQSKAQARYIESQILLHDNVTLSMNPDVVRLPVVYEPIKFYVAMVGLGTFNDSQKTVKNYYLMIDTGSDLTWLQCEGAIKAFNQDMPLYPWNSSSTYRPIPCDTHPLCKGDMCNADGQCIYKVRYGSGSVTSGILAIEKFTLGSNTGGLERIDLEMGCGFRQDNFKNFIGKNHLRGKPDLIAGILGLGPGSWSFLNQLGAAGEGKFSYCFEAFKYYIEGSNTYLRFGADATIGGASQEVRTTPIVVPQFRSYQYYLNLEDISVGSKRINFPSGTFEIKSRREGGAIIDTGAIISHMYKDHFDIVSDLVKTHFKELGVEYIGAMGSLDVCFRLRGRFDIHNYPSITLHFQQADYFIPDYKANFVMLSIETICFGYLRSDKNRFILGSMQQANKRILYNIMDRSLSFAEEYCTLDS